MQYVFPDTNVFLHGKYFEDIDWCGWLDHSEVTLLIAPVVIAELDKHKYNAVSKISRRARKLLPRFETILEEPQLSNYRFSVLLKRPTDSTFDKNQLDKKEQDDELLATILEFSSTIDKENTVILITNDTGLRLKARAFGINSIKLPEEYMQAPELDESEKKVLALQQELQQFKNKVPIIELRFNDGQPYLTVKKTPEIKSEVEYVEQELTKIKKEYPVLAFKENDAIQLGDQKIRLPLFNLSQSQVDNYNHDLSNFFKAYAAYFKSQYEHLAFRYNSAELSIIVKNVGSVPAIDLDVQFHYPDGFDIIDVDKFPEIKEKPTAPYKPKHSMDFKPFDLGVGLVAPLYGMRDFRPDLSKINSNVSSPDIKKTNSYDVNFHIKSVKHNQFIELDTLYLKFPDIKKAMSFTIDYKVMASNIPKLITGQLHVKFE
ncbi:MAG TPA: PIN domain-containing protein [Chitinophagaceae bacterium]|nr:PIN domain-containing protein [Chitinophagaceae bacterium]